MYLIRRCGRFGRVGEAGICREGGEITSVISLFGWSDTQVAKQATFLHTFVRCSDEKYVEDGARRRATAESVITGS